MTFAYLTDAEYRAVSGQWEPWHPRLNEHWPYEHGRTLKAQVWNEHQNKAERTDVRFYRHIPQERAR